MSKFLGIDEYENANNVMMHGFLMCVIVSIPDFQICIGSIISDGILLSGSFHVLHVNEMDLCSRCLDYGLWSCLGSAFCFGNGSPSFESPTVGIWWRKQILIPDDRSWIVLRKTRYLNPTWFFFCVKMQYIIISNCIMIVWLR